MLALTLLLLAQWQIHLLNCCDPTKFKCTSAVFLQNLTWNKHWRCVPSFTCLPPCTAWQRCCKAETPLEMLQKENERVAMGTATVGPCSHYHIKLLQGDFVIEGPWAAAARLFWWQIGWWHDGANEAGERGKTWRWWGGGGPARATAAWMNQKQETNI